MVSGVGDGEVTVNGDGGRSNNNNNDDDDDDGGGGDVPWSGGGGGGRFLAFQWCKMSFQGIKQAAGCLYADTHSLDTYKHTHTHIYLTLTSY